MSADEARTLDILDHGHLERLDYDGLLRFHRDDAVWGAAVAFRALQRAAQSLSQPALWDRRTLSITSAHPGPGVKDAIEYVTRCVSRGRYRLTQPEREGQCHRGMEFAWWLDDGRKTVAVRLRETFVPEEFFTLIDRLGTAVEKPGDRERLGQLKAELTSRLWVESLDALFYVTEATHPPEEAIPACTN